MSALTYVEEYESLLGAYIQTTTLILDEIRRVLSFRSRFPTLRHTFLSSAEAQHRGSRNAFVSLVFRPFQLKTFIRHR